MTVFGGAAISILSMATRSARERSQTLPPVTFTDRSIELAALRTNYPKLTHGQKLELASNPNDLRIRFACGMTVEDLAE